jgi:hypothetical protein
MLPIVGGPVSEGMRKGVIADLTSGKRKGRFRFDSIDAAVAYGMGVLLMAVRTALTDRIPKDFDVKMAAMLLQGYGMQREEARRIAALPLPLALAERSPAGIPGEMTANPFGSHLLVRSGCKTAN